MNLDVVVHRADEVRVRKTAGGDLRFVSYGFHRRIPESKVRRFIESRLSPASK